MRASRARACMRARAAHQVLLPGDVELHGLTVCLGCERQLARDGLDDVPLALEDARSEAAHRLLEQADARLCLQHLGSFAVAEVAEALRDQPHQLLPPQPVHGLDGLVDLHRPGREEAQGLVNVIRAGLPIGELM